SFLESLDKSKDPSTLDRFAEICRISPGRFRALVVVDHDLDRQLSTSRGSSGFLVAGRSNRLEGSRVRIDVAVRVARPARARSARSDPNGDVDPHARAVAGGSLHRSRPIERAPDEPTTPINL